MTLTVTEYADIRQVTGADDNVEFTDFQIQAQYDRALVDAPETADVLPYTYVYILRRLWGIRRTSVDRTTEHGDNERRSQEVTNTKVLLDYWEGVSGLTSNRGGRLTAGAISLGLDQEETTGNGE